LGFIMEMRFADRMGKVKKSFIREILKVTADPSIISFAGGLPNPVSFPVDAIAKASDDVLREDGANVLQYSTTEGYLPLRRYIAGRYYKRFGLTVDPDGILITNGSQQALDLLGKVFLNKDDDVLIERPGYLGAIQALSIFEPRLHSVSLGENGVDLNELEEELTAHNPKLFYAVPNFQNPSGLSYSEENRKRAAEILSRHNTIFIEDDPYGELRFYGENVKSMKNFYNDGTVLLGSFSKIVSPGMRIGWVCAGKEIMEKLIIAKQAADLHTNYLSQRILYRYLSENDIDSHISKITSLYKSQCDCMTAMIQKYFPNQVSCTKPKGGMFMWVTLPKGLSSLDLFELAAKKSVAFVPGDPFYIDASGTNTLRLNYTNADENKIEEGIRRLASAIDELMNR
jgi:2-aminoadipate transaminase